MYYIESAMAGDTLTEAKKKHNLLCNTLDGMITEESFQSIKRMAMTYLVPKQVEKAKSMNDLLHKLEIKGVISVGNYDELIDLIQDAGIGIGIDAIRETDKEIKIIMQSRIDTQAREKKMKGKATSAKCQMANKKKRKHKEDIKVKCVKKKSISKNPDTTRVKKMKGKATKAKCQIDKKRKGKRKANGKAKSVKKKSISKNPDSNKSSLKEAYQSIESLTLNQSSCKIRARLTMKLEKGSKKKKNIEGGFNQKEYFQFKVIDKSGEIEGFAYDDAVDKFYGVLKMGKVFCIRATLKKAKKKFNSTRHNCQIVLNKDACIKPCEDTSDIPRYGIFAFKTIDELKDLRPGELVDLLAVVKESGESEAVLTRKRKRKEKRDILLVDQSGKQVGLTLWERDAKQFLSKENLVIALKGVKVSDWAGRSLTMLPMSQKFYNPKIKGVKKLRQWFICEGKKMVFTGFQ